MTTYTTSEISPFIAFAGRKNGLLEQHAALFARIARKEDVVLAHHATNSRNAAFVAFLPSSVPPLLYRLSPARIIAHKLNAECDKKKLNYERCPVPLRCSVPLYPPFLSCRERNRCAVGGKGREVCFVFCCDYTIFCCACEGGW